MDRTLRWMSENLGGAKRAVHPPGHKNAGDYCTNSGTGILVCCYINALGKVLCKGKGRDGERFRTFVRTCMQDFLNAKSTQSLPRTPRGNTGGEHWLYEVYRCGFVHQFYPSAGAWTRKPKSALYWLHQNGKVTLNIDALVKGFKHGVAEFTQQVKLDPDLRTNFRKYITAGD